MIGELGSCCEPQQRALCLHDEWNLMRTKPRREDLAAANLVEMGVEVLFPRLQVRQRFTAFFPGYLFVRIPKPVFWDALRAPGVAKIVRFGENHAVVEQAVIDSLLARMGAGGEIDLQRFESGDRVRVVAGPLVGFNAVFDTYLSSDDRCRILLESINRDKALNAQVSCTDIVPV